ncbi:MAG: serine hydrolase domain-containing protein [Bacteroidales bacterium]
MNMKMRMLLFTLLIPFSGYAEKLNKRTAHYIDSIMNHALEELFFPGAQVFVGRYDKILYARNFGYKDYDSKQRVSANNLYDMASCSKVIGTTLVAMRLYDKGMIRLDSRVGELLETYRNTPLAGLTFLELMTHVTGLRPFIPFYKECMNDPQYLSYQPLSGYNQVSGQMWINPAFYKRVDEQIAQAQQPDKIGKYQYSDLNLYVVQRMLEEVGGKPLDQLADQIFKELHMHRTGYKPLRKVSMKHIIPTETDSVFRMQTIRGYTHDEFAAILGNVAGHAGLFSNAREVSFFCRMIINQGRFHRKQIIKEETIRLFTSSPYLEKQIYRGIGFDKRNPDSGIYSLHSFGHTGFTGTYFWIDADTGLYLILLTNRVHPTRKNTKMYNDNLRDKIWSRLHGKEYTE